MKASLTRMTPRDEKPAEETRMEKGPVTGSGIVRSLMPDMNMVNLQHEPIPDLGWPGMTMDFRLAEGVSVEGLQEGDGVTFRLEERDGSYLITGIEKASGTEAKP
ncbi:MAG TPA: copper-binding protein [Chromatiales bacterium]|nr:copper-binding protein [Chromatiales bacterium]